MSEQQCILLPGDVRLRPAGRGDDAPAPARAAGAEEPAGRTGTGARVGETSTARRGTGLTPAGTPEVTRGPQDALCRWLRLDDGAGQSLAVLTTGPGTWREHTPGDPATGHTTPGAAR
ncbi:hypothetical protein [Streptomyces luteireticuli]|uniref:hypothetical protein n=1 Tax=Streptomyces luteireticuli TaxID=173858 RepID=UPI003556C3F1